MQTQILTNNLKCANIFSPGIIITNLHKRSGLECEELERVNILNR